VAVSSDEVTAIERQIAALEKKLKEVRASAATQSSILGPIREAAIQGARAEKFRELKVQLVRAALANPQGLTPSQIAEAADISRQALYQRPYKD
jgi:hypothetical protein